MVDVSEFFPDPMGLTRDQRDTLMHAYPVFTHDH